MEQPAPNRRVESAVPSVTKTSGTERTGPSITGGCRPRPAVRQNELQIGLRRGEPFLNALRFEFCQKGRPNDHQLLRICRHPVLTKQGIDDPGQAGAATRISIQCGFDNRLRPKQDFVRAVAN